MEKHFVSVIIPCRNEEKFIGKCLQSLVLQDWPKENLEILVADGDSKDQTRQIIKDYSLKYSFIRGVDNPKKFTPFALNIAINRSKGDIIIRMDSHADYQPNYISKCVYYLEKYKADNVGGIIRTVPKEKTPWAKAIAMSLTSFFGVGNAHFRKGTKNPMWVDTVFGGCYRKEIFNKIGLFNEKLIRGQDIEFNRRLKESGGHILLVPEIVAFYYPQPTFFKFLKHNFTDGFWTLYPLSKGIRIFSWRHLLPLFFVSGLLILLLLSFISGFFLDLFLVVIVIYFVTGLLFSIKPAVKNTEFDLAFLMPFAFAARHFGYGAGSLFAIPDLIIAKFYGRKKKERN